MITPNDPASSYELASVAANKAAIKQKLVNDACALQAHVSSVIFAMEFMKLSCLLNPNLTMDQCARILGAPVKHRFIRLDGTTREEACCL
jgi:hypothetical protein